MNTVLVISKRSSSGWFWLLIGICGLLLFLSGQSSNTLQASPLTAPTLYVLPGKAAPGAALVLTGHDLPPGVDMAVFVGQADNRDHEQIALVQLDDRGLLETTVSLPYFPSGEYELTLRDDAGIVAGTTLTILPELILELEPDGGPPGTEIAVTVRNLIPGSLSLEYAGVPAVGPLSVTEESYSGSFIVPANRPDTLGEMTMVTAVNLVNGHVVGQTQRDFQSESPAGVREYSITNVVLPTDETLLPGDNFTINGQISPAPNGSIDQFQIQVLWKDAEGNVFPINSTIAEIQSNGNFQVEAHMPGFQVGDPLLPQPGAQLGLSLVQMNSDRVATAAVDPEAMLKVLDAQFTVGVYHQENGKNIPIPDAIVRIRPYAGEKDTFQDTISLSGSNNQVVAYAGTQLPPDPNPFYCPTNDLYGRTDENGLFTTYYTPFEAPPMSQAVYKAPNGKTVYMLAPTFELVVDASQEGYGHVDADKQPEPFRQEMAYALDPYTKKPTYYIVKKNGLWEAAASLFVGLPELPEGVKVGILGILTVPGAQTTKTLDNYIGSGAPLTMAGEFLSFHNKTIFPDSLFTVVPPPIRIQFQHDPQIHGSLDESKTRLILDGKTYPFYPETLGNGPCKATTYTAEIPNPHRLSAGTHWGTVIIVDVTGAETARHFGLVGKNPPEWIGDTSYFNRTIKITNGYSLNNGYKVEMRGDRLDPNVSKYQLASHNDTVPYLGSTIDNSISPHLHVKETVWANGNHSSYVNGNLAVEVINNTAPTQQLNSNGAANDVVTFSYGPKTLFSSGKVPIFQVTAPVLGGAVIIESGGNIWFDATLSYDGSIKISDPPSTKITVTPKAGVTGEVYVEGHLFLFVAEGGGKLKPAINLNMPITYVDDQVKDVNACLTYKMDLIAYGGLICDPSPLDLGCLLPTSYSKELFNNHVGKCGSSQLVLNNEVLADAPAFPPSLRPVVATDGFGHTLVLWRAQKDRLASSTYDGLSWSEPQFLQTGLGSTDVQVVYFAPNQAVAVWAESALTAAQAKTASMADILNSYHLAYAVWNGSNWSPAMSLTSATTGDGHVALASCSATNPVCPSGGGVTAVWTRDIAGDLAQRQFRLYYATYEGISGTWTAPQAVDVTSTASDDLADVAYDGNGVPLVAWIRDVDRDLNTLNDRTIAWHRLINGAAVETPAALPDQVVELSLAFDGNGDPALAFTRPDTGAGLLDNRRVLHIAKYSCNPSGSCIWNETALTDSHGRAIYVESPQLTFDKQGMGTITFRGMGFGPLADGTFMAYADEAWGMATGMGDLAQIEVDFANPVADPHYLTNNGAVNWQPTAVYDPVLDQIHAVVVQGDTPMIPAQFRSQMNAVSDQMSIVASGEVVDQEALYFANIPRQPDFVVTGVTPSSRYPLPGEPLTAEVALRNNGLAWQVETGQPLNVVATWDGPYGVGMFAGEAELDSLAAGKPETLILSLALPANLDFAHTLHITVNPIRDIAEQSGVNNTMKTAVGGIPAPVNVTAAAQAGDPVVQLEWTSPEDPRIAGYRIYRSTYGSDWQPVGNTFVEGFVDLTVDTSKTYTYTVAAYTLDGLESIFSNQIKVNTDTGEIIYLPLILQTP